jgi:heme/copper-type cytochrome/quinol oxidase subunit 3
LTDYSATRSMQATTPLGSALAESRRVARPNGWWGMAIFVATEATLFGTMIGTYFYLRFRTVHWPPAGVPDPKVVVPLVLTGVLVLTSALMQFALASAQRARLSLVRLALIVALIVQSGYFAMQLHLFLDDLHKFSPNASAYASIYFTLVGAHHFHVVVGILLNAWLLLRFVGGITNYRLIALQATIFYWHFINVLAVVVTLTQISPSL